MKEKKNEKERERESKKFTNKDLFLVSFFFRINMTRE